MDKVEYVIKYKNGWVVKVEDVKCVFEIKDIKKDVIEWVKEIVVYKGIEVIVYLVDGSV